ncbi:MAG: zinc-ribbon and DUF3426 domain-containing protein [Gammaproteobacteria bacterium]|nr:zinc-ribbon and DUF3426 domain-containing protein [Gammaproteobacteria bacterium]
MSKERQTQCPSCGSTFQVNNDQLEVASGAVRCGNCLDVFQADEYFTDEQAEQVSAISAASLYETTESNEQDGVDESWALELLKDLEDEPASEDEASPAIDKDIPSIISEPVLPTLNTNNNEDGDEVTQKKSDNLSDTFQNIDNWSSEGHDQFGDFSGEGGGSNNTGKSDAPGNEDWAKKMLADETSNEDDTSGTPELKKTQPAATSQKANKDIDPPSITVTTDPFGIGEELDDFVSQSETPDANLDAKEVIATIELEPVALDLNDDDKESLTHRLGELALILVASLLLGTQYFTYNFQSLSKDPVFRPWYSKACSSLNCTLPPQSDIQKIRGKNLVVRTHPDIRNALLVDIVMTNHASFSQKLPLLELSFSDINSFPVAGRTFTPSEYLSGALLKLQNMPAKTPIHISLAIFDPGDEAINYHVNFHKSN